MRWTLGFMVDMVRGCTEGGILLERRMHVTYSTGYTSQQAIPNEWD